jgi:hypothetical protein
LLGARPPGGAAVVCTCMSVAVRRNVGTSSCFDRARMRAAYLSVCKRVGLTFCLAALTPSFNAASPPEPITPNIDELATTGLRLDNFCEFAVLT